jgi:hypothetical protein
MDIHRHIRVVQGFVRGTLLSNEIFHAHGGLDGGHGLAWNVRDNYS